VEAKTAKTHAHRLARLDAHFGTTTLGRIRPRDVAAYIRDALAERSELYPPKPISADLSASEPATQAEQTRPN
jgi:hypothetical protein